MDPDERLELIALIAQDRAWDTVVFVGRAVLDRYYPADVFTGESADAGPVFIAALRAALRACEGEGK